MSRWSPNHGISLGGYLKSPRLTLTPGEKEERAQKPSPHPTEVREAGQVLSGSDEMLRASHRHQSGCYFPRNGGGGWQVSQQTAAQGPGRYGMETAEL